MGQARAGRGASVSVRTRPRHASHRPHWNPPRRPGRPGWPAPWGFTSSVGLAVLRGSSQGPLLQVAGCVPTPLSRAFRTLTPSSGELACRLDQPGRQQSQRRSSRRRRGSWLLPTLLDLPTPSLGGRAPDDQASPRDLCTDHLTGTTVVPCLCALSAHLRFPRHLM